jgi:Leucine-rich repeat (LRR) protein
MQTIRVKKNNIVMPVLHENNIDFELEDFDDERCQGLLIRQTTSYSTRTDKPVKLSARQTSDMIAVNQAIACALKSTPKAFHYAQKHLQYLPPSIQHLAVCETIRELDLQGNHLKILPDEIGNLKSIEICNLGKMI